MVCLHLLHIPRADVTGCLQVLQVATVVVSVMLVMFDRSGENSKSN